MTLRGIALLIASCMIIGACSDDEETLADRRRDLTELRASEATEAGWTELAEVLADGQVTATEYDGLVASYIECAGAAGASMSDPVAHPANPRLRVTAPVNRATLGAAEGDALEECRAKFLSVEELLWEDPAPMSPTLADAIRDCMGAADHELGPDDDDLADMARAVGQDGRDALAQCASSEVATADPSLPFVSIALPSIL